MFSADILHGKRAPAATITRRQEGENDFLKVIAVDLSPLELRFENVFSRLTAIEEHLQLSQHQKMNHELNDINDDIVTEGGASAADKVDEIYPVDQTDTNTDGSETKVEAESPTQKQKFYTDEKVDEIYPVDQTDTNTEGSETKVEAESPTPKQKFYTDGVTFAHEIESLRAAQLRIKVDQEVANSALQLEMVKLRSNLEQGIATYLQQFRDDVVATSITSTKALQTKYHKLEQTMDLTFAEKQVAENRWKAMFEETIAARIQDIWSGLHATSRKLQESLQYLQSEMVTHGESSRESSREMNSFVDTMKASSERLDRESKEHAKMLVEQEVEIEQLHGLYTQASLRLDEQDGKLTNQVGKINQQIEDGGVRVQQHVQAYDAFVAMTDKSFTALASDLTTCNSTLTKHQTSIHSLDLIVLRHNDELVRIDERMGPTEARIGSIDSRVTLTEKKITNTVGVIQEHHQERQQVEAAIQSSLNQAAIERASIKHNLSDLGFSLQEAQLKVQEVSKFAGATDTALTRTTAELPKLHALLTTNSSNIAKNRQSIRDITIMIEDDRKIAKTLRKDFNKEVADSVTRFTTTAERDELAQEAITNASITAAEVKSELEARIVKNGNLIHQLNTMVDSLAITETTEDMESKTTSFAVACAQFGLKLEFFGRKQSSVDGACVTKDDVKENLAVLLAKIIRFLGSGVSIDQNKYLLTARRPQAVDPITGQIIMEIPPQHVLESFRIAKAKAFSKKTRNVMDQLQPVVKTNRTSIDFRDAFERKLRFVLEFGLANLFPNMGKPKNPLNRRGGEFGTCIACDRPIDGDEPQNDPEDSDIPLRHRAQQEVVLNSKSDEPVPEQQRSISPKPRPSSAAVRNRIDTKTVVRGRSGSSTIRPKSGSDSVHCAPGTGEFVYRGGFRIPRSNSNAVMSGSINSLHSLSAQATPNTTEELSNNGPLDVDMSCLEKVALVGKHQVVDTSSVSSSSAGGGVEQQRTIGCGHELFGESGVSGETPSGGHLVR
ncbi:Chromosome segregation ATPase [Phytophthora megakarya]|uniref:Chromosome segregation ATPase n=1 Tax=Phytophthora megakarya TaxID=4795 RepID=A0A225X322_9STRA|nr:Chromosome segregation ATPase [Phytophthora megakarya]